MSRESLRIEIFALIKAGHDTDDMGDGVTEVTAEGKESLKGFNLVQAMDFNGIVVNVCHFINVLLMSNLMQ